MTDAQKERKRQRYKAWSQANSEKVREYKRKWRQAHPDYSRELYKANPEKVIERVRDWRKANPEKNRETDRKRREANREQFRCNHRKWQNANRERIREYLRKRRVYNPQFAIACRLRNNLRRALQSVSATKGQSAIKLLGCSVESFQGYIERKFKQGMTWRNTHLDHIIPCALFDLTKPEHQARCFNFRNFQPLFIEDNLKKGARLFHEPELLRL